jgi:UDP-N-acetylglucosamine:LPS N-acetylglucosamine transferase
MKYLLAALTASFIITAYAPDANAAVSKGGVPVLPALTARWLFGAAPSKCDTPMLKTVIASSDMMVPSCQKASIIADSE